MCARRSTPSTTTGAGPLPAVLLVFFLLYCLVLPSLAGARPVVFRGSAAHHERARRAAVDGTYNITGQPNANGSAAVSVFGDGDPAVEYSSGWSVRTSTSLNLTDGMEHVTTTHGSSATFSFRGTAVTLIGTTGPNHGTFTVRLDGKVHKGLSSKSAHPLVGQALFHVGGLADGQSHRFVLTHADDKGVELDVDAFVVWNDAASPTPSPTPVTATTLACGSSATARGHSYALSVSDSGGIGFPACPTGLTATSLASESIVGGGSSILSRRVSSLQSNIPTSPPGGLGAADAKHKTELTVGAVLGSLAGLALLVGVLWLVYSRRKTDGGADGRRPSVFGGRAPSHDLSPTSSNSQSTPATHGSNGTRSTGVMIETALDGPAPVVAGALAARPHIQDMPERSFAVTRSVRIQAPITPVTLSRGLFGRPHTGESALSIDTGTSHTHPNPSKNYGTLATRPTTGSSDRHPSGSGSGSSNDHSGGGRSPGPRAFDPYLSRRSSVLSVRNPDLELDTPSEEEIADPFQNEVSPDGSPWEYDRRSLYSTSSPPVPFPNGGGMPLPPEPVAPLPVLPGPGGFPFRRRVSTIGEVDEPTMAYSDRSAYATPSDILPPPRSRGPFAGGTPSPRSTPEGGSGAGSLRGTPAGGSGAGSLAARPSGDTGSYTPWDVQDVSFSAFPFNVPAVPPSSASRRPPPPPGG